jgi:hypothetical protein
MIFLIKGIKRIFFIVGGFFPSSMGFFQVKSSYDGGKPSIEEKSLRIVKVNLPKKKNHLKQAT